MPPLHSAIYKKSMESNQLKPTAVYMRTGTKQEAKQEEEADSALLALRKGYAAQAQQKTANA